MIGLLKAEIGIGQAGRSAAKALEAVGYPHSRHNITVPLFEEIVDFECKATFDSAYPSALIYLNADTLVTQSEVLRFANLEGKRWIGFWHWELPLFPHAWTRAIEMVEEIWTPSSIHCGVESAPQPTSQFASFHMPYRLPDCRFAPPGNGWACRRTLSSSCRYSIRTPIWRAKIRKQLFGHLRMLFRIPRSRRPSSS